MPAFTADVARLRSLHRLVSTSGLTTYKQS